MFTSYEKKVTQFLWVSLFTFIVLSSEPVANRLSGTTIKHVTSLPCPEKLLVQFPSFRFQTFTFKSTKPHANAFYFDYSLLIIYSIYK